MYVECLKERAKEGGREERRREGGREERSG